MKQYKVEFTVRVYDAVESYQPKTPLEFRVTEKLPANVEAQTYIRRRLAEEMKRNFDAMNEPIENMTDEAEAKQDPLADPF